MDSLTLIQKVAVAILPLLFAITVHETAHGWVASRLGDKTAMMLGRLTLNPLKHIDPLGTVVVPLMMLVLSTLSGSFMVFGWAKPVPVTVENLHNPRRDMALVAVAGPLANLLMALMWGVFAKLGYVLAPQSEWFATPLILMGGIGISINLLLMVLNLLPLPPLDGGRVLVSILPGPWAWKVSRIEPYGFIILLTLAFTGILWVVISAPMSAMQKAIFFLLGL